LTAEKKLWEDCGPEEDERYRRIIRDREEHSPYYQLIGLEISGLGRGWASIRMPAGDRLHNLGGIVHGGAITSIADAAAGVALATLLDKETERPVTIELKINFCSPVREGVIEARGEVVHRGGRIAVSEAEVSAAGKLVAKAMATYMVFKMPVPGAE
jgi:acyl-CoA thioesterase